MNGCVGTGGVNVGAPSGSRGKSPNRRSFFLKLLLNLRKCKIFQNISET